MKLPKTLIWTWLWKTRGDALVSVKPEANVHIYRNRRSRIQPMMVLLLALFVCLVGFTSPFVHPAHADDAVDDGDPSGGGGGGGGGVTNLPGVSVTATPDDDDDDGGVTNLPGVSVTATPDSGTGGAPVTNLSPVVVTAHIGPHGGGSAHVTASTAPTTSKKNSQNPCPNAAGDPIMMNTGSKAIELTDFAEPGEMGLTFKRYYNSKALNGTATYGSWSTSVDFHLFNTTCQDINGVANPCGAVRLFRPDGSVLNFSPITPINEPTQGGVVIQQSGPFYPVGTATLTFASGIYTLHEENSHVETFDASGNLLSIKDLSGIGWTISHNGARGTYPYVTTVTHTNGQSYSITVNQPDASSNRQATVVDPAGNSYAYSTTGDIGLFFSSTSEMGRINSVTYPGSPARTVSYKYQSPTLSMLDELTETDVNGVPHDVTTYDSNGNANMTSMADGSQKLSIVYTTDASGHITSATQTNALGHVNVYQYNGQGLLTSITGEASANCAAAFASNTYDANGFLTTSTDNNGNVTKYSYTASGLLLQKVEAASTAVQRVTDYTWDSTPGTDRPLSVKIEGLSQTDYTYDSGNKLASTKMTNLTNVGNIPPLVTTYAYTYQANGTVATKTVTIPSANNADTITYTYDALGRVTQVSDGLGHTTRYGNYNGLGKPGTVTNANGDATNYAYDARGRVTSVTHTHGGATNTGLIYYDANSGQPSLRALFDNEQTRNTYDADFKLTRSVWTGPSGAAITTSYSYDANGDVTTVTKTLAGSSTPAVSQNRAYDQLGRVISVSGNHGQNTSISYDRNDNPVSVTDALGHATTTVYDALNRPIKVTDANGQSSQSVYGLDDKIHQFIDNRGLSTTYSYDGFGNVWTLNSPDTATTQYAYDGTGHLASVTPATAIPRSISYDAIYRVTAVTAGGETHTFTYDNCTNGIGQLCAEGTPNTSSSYGYTPEGWLAQRTDNNILGPSTRGYAYDGMGRVIQLTLPSSGITAVNYTWNDDQVASVTVSLNGAASQTVATNITYDVLRHPISWTYGNGLGHSQTYDSDGRLTGLASGATGNMKVNMGFAYDASNRLTNLVNSAYTNLSQNFTYDAVDRLTAMTGPAPLNLGYDSNGNRNAQSGQAGGAVTVDGVSNRILSRGVHTYSYDASGSRIRDAIAGSTLTYTYDGFGRMRTASRDQAATVCETYNACPTYSAGNMTYVVSARGQRMSKTDPNGETVWYSYLQSGQLADELSTKRGYNYYIYLGDQPIGVVHNPLIVNTDTLYYVHADQMGRPEIISDSAGNNQWAGVNYAFDGGVLFTGAVTGIDIGLPGQIADIETGNWSNGFRDYASSDGRYLESDPIGLGGGMNTYAYVENNPLNGSDSWGLAVHHEVPGNAQLYQAGNGATFYAPGYANWAAINIAGQVNGPDPIGINAAVGHNGMYDFQRSNGDFYTAYTNASNYAVGDFMQGAGFSESETIFIANEFARHFSSNYGDPKQIYWWKLGWQDANKGITATPIAGDPCNP